MGAAAKAIFFVSVHSVCSGIPVYVAHLFSKASVVYSSWWKPPSSTGDGAAVPGLLSLRLSAMTGTSPLFGAYEVSGYITLVSIMNSSCVIWTSSVLTSRVLRVEGWVPVIEVTPIVAPPVGSEARLPIMIVVVEFG